MKPAIRIKKQIQILTVMLSLKVFQVGLVFGQTQVYDNFEGNKSIHYGARTGVLDTLVKNPAPNQVDSSAKCALYVRNSTKKFDNIKMSVSGKLTGVNEYATYLGVPPQLKMKVYTTAPVGTLVEILLGCKGRNNEYPAGTHSQYQAYTTVTNTWEELNFKFSQVPEGSETSATQIDQITLLFNPNTSTSDTYYFDDITGPVVTAADKPDLLATPADPQKKEIKK
jgi:hypothetical protein